MAVKAITAAQLNAAKNHRQNQNTKNNNPSFQGLEQIPVAVADAITNGGFAFSFIAQDCVGMALPRIGEGLNRRPVNPETGKKEGPYNWAFARREGIREILSGPSAFIIPAAILHFVKKYSGSANNVPVSMIQGLGANFVDYASKNSATLDDVVKTKQEFYQGIFKNVLHTTLNGKLPEDKLNDLAYSFMQRAIEIEEAKDNKKSLLKKILNKKVEGSPEDLTESLLRDFMALKKKYLPASVNEVSAALTIDPNNVGKTGIELRVAAKENIGFTKLLKTMTDFTDDVIETTGRAMKKAKDGFNPEEFLKNFVARRSGSRIITNMGMWSAVVGFYALIPKLYSLGLKGKNPAFMNEQGAEKADNKKEADTEKTTKIKNGQEPSFGGKEHVFANTAEKVLGSNKLKSFLSHFEFDGPAMSVPAMLGLLFGFCLPTRLIKAYKTDKQEAKDNPSPNNKTNFYDVKETLARDITSFGAILFAAHGIARGFSNIFSKISGLALNVKPAEHDKNLWHKFKDYFSPMGGINVLDNRQLESKYTNIHEYNKGINGFFEFIEENGGNLKKMLKMDKDVAEQTKIILGKDLKDASRDEIVNAFKNITTDEAKKALETIENVFKNSKNKFVKRAKVYNSMFTALSTIALVPAFMIWLARTCDKMTRNARAKDLAAREANSVTNKKQELENTVASVAAQARLSGAAPTMAGFIGK